MSRHVAQPDMPEHLSLDYVKWKHVDEVLASVGHNRTAAAKILRISRRTLYRMLASRDLVSDQTTDHR